MMQLWFATPRMLFPLVLAAVLPAATLRAEGDTAEKLPESIVWKTDYSAATKAARSRHSMLFIFFRAPGKDRVADHFESAVLSDHEVKESLSTYVCVKLSRDATITIDGRPVKLLDHAAFRDMQGRQGVAILDFTDPTASHYGRVVSALPFDADRCYSARQMLVVLELPRGDDHHRRRLLAERLRRLLPGRRHAHEPSPAESVGPTVEVAWMSDYAAAVRKAEKERKMLLIRFEAPSGNARCERFERETLADAEVRRKLRDYVCLRLPLGATVELDGDPPGGNSDDAPPGGGKQVVLLKHSAMAEMLGQPGVAIIDFAHPEAEHYGRVVSTFPLTGKLWFGPEQMKVILDLPPGTLTQRTLIYAVRVHPDRPASTSGKIDPYLVAQAESHSRHQAQIRRQGHHQWETRFHQINARLSGGLSAVEVCAESWPGERLVEAAIECVHCWRQSSGHWSAVRAAHPLYGYDMKRGSNGIWYATGISGKQ
jgi:hypothetical protein